MNRLPVSRGIVSQTLWKQLGFMRGPSGERWLFCVGRAAHLSEEGRQSPHPGAVVGSQHLLCPGHLSPPHLIIVVPVVTPRDSFAIALALPG